MVIVLGYDLFLRGSFVWKWSYFVECLIEIIGFGKLIVIVVWKDRGNFFLLFRILKVRIGVIYYYKRSK